MTFQQEVREFASYNVDGFYITAFTDGKYAVDYIGHKWFEEEFYKGEFNHISFNSVEHVYDFLLDSDFLNGEEEIYVLEEIKQVN